MGLIDFFGRHRNKILILGGTAGAAVIVLKKIMANYEKQWESNPTKGFVHDVRKKEIHFENIIDECNQLCRKVCPKISNYLQTLLDVTKLIEHSKGGNNNNQQDKSIQSKIETWKLLKVKILTRLLSEIYSTCILICYLRMIKSVAGGRIFATTINNNSNINGGSSSATVADLTHIKTYTKLNSLISSLNEQKFDCLIQPIEEAVEETLRGFSVDYKISVEDFKEILEKIKRSMSFHLLSPTFKISQLFLDTNSTFENSGSYTLTDDDHIMLHKILTDSNNIMESEDFKQVLESSIEIGYECLINILQDAFIKMNLKLNSTSSNNRDDDCEKRIINLNNIKLPIIKIFPQILENYSNRSESEQRILTNQLLSLDVINCYAANIYDEFCFST